MKQILIVDDQQDIRLSASLVLTHHGYQCLEADSPLQALAIIEQQQIDLLLLDMNFNKDTTSGEEGLALLKQLSEMNLSLPIVVMTAWASVDIAVQAMQLGAGDFVEKPWQNNRLLSGKRHRTMYWNKAKNRLWACLHQRVHHRSQSRATFRETCSSFANFPCSCLWRQ